MDAETFRDHCLAKKGVSEDMPFDDRTLVFRVMNKIFAFSDVNLFERVSLKCDPERALDLREKYNGIIPGYHLNKQHWNTVLMNSDVPDSLVLELTDHSYELIVAGLPARVRKELSSQ